MQETNPVKTSIQRPLSPHLQVYRLTLSMLMSITHRITGVALFAGMLLFVWWLTAASQSDAYFDFVQGIFGSWPGRVVLFGFTWALIHHLLGGLRHFLWDFGKGFDLATVDNLARLNLIGSIVLTVTLWALGCGAKP